MRKVVTSVVLAAVFITLATAAERPLVKLCVEDQQQEDHLRVMMSDSMDQAFKQHMMHLFDIWIKEQAEEPERAVTGANIGIDAYVRSIRGLRKWKPQRC